MARRKRDQLITVVAILVALWVAIFLAPAQNYHAALASCGNVSGGTAILRALPGQVDAGGAVLFQIDVLDAIFYEWDFDYDGVELRPEYYNKSGGDVYYTYNLPGTYTVRVRIYFTSGAILDHQAVVTVLGQADLHTVILGSDAPAAAPPPLTVQFTATVGDPSKYLYFWDFDGDGVDDYCAASDPTATYVYREPGFFTARVKVVDARGRASAATTLVVVSPSVNQPLAIFTAPPVTVDLGDVVTFQIFATTPVGTVDQYRWDFDGDGVIDAVTTVSTSPPFQFLTPGTCHTRAVVVNSLGISRSISVLVDRDFNPAVLRCWITNPRDQKIVEGILTIHAYTTPGIPVTGVDFFYRPSGTIPWIPIGTAGPLPDSRFGVPWDTRTLLAGNYELRALATGASGPPADSAAIQIPTVGVRTAPADITETMSPPARLAPSVVDVRSQLVDPVLYEDSEINRHTLAHLPAEATLSLDILRRERRSLDPHPQESKLQFDDSMERSYFDPGTFTRQSFEGGAVLRAPQRVTHYLGAGDLGPFLGSPAGQKAVRRLFHFNPVRKTWYRAVDTVYHPGGAIVQGTLGAAWDSGVAIELDRTSSSGGSGCGLLGLEAAVALFLLRRRRRT